MSKRAIRHATVVEERTVYVAAGGDRVRVGDLDRIIELVGGPAWTITYSERQKRRQPDLDTSDEGLTVDVVDVVNGMEVEAEFLEALRRLPIEAADETSVPPRTGLFVGRLLGSLETGLE